MFWGHTRLFITSLGKSFKVRTRNPSQERVVYKCANLLSGGLCCGRTVGGDKLRARQHVEARYDRFFSKHSSMIPVVFYVRAGGAVQELLPIRCIGRMLGSVVERWKHFSDVLSAHWWRLPTFLSSFLRDYAWPLSVIAFLTHL